jgi:hypothetical protein
MLGNHAAHRERQAPSPTAKPMNDASESSSLGEERNRLTQALGHVIMLPTRPRPSPH